MLYQALQNTAGDLFRAEVLEDNKYNIRAEVLEMYATFRWLTPDAYSAFSDVLATLGSMAYQSWYVPNRIVGWHFQTRQAILSHFDELIDFKFLRWERQAQIF